eukprot:jgi/Galph1/3131/GphlegSOOS_G1820.1
MKEKLVGTFFSEEETGECVSSDKCVNEEKESSNAEQELQPQLVSESEGAEESSKSCFAVNTWKNCRKAKVRHLLSIKPEQAPQKSCCWYSKENLRKWANSPALYFLDSVLIAVNLLIFLAKYIVMFTTDWRLDRSSRYAYIVTTWLQTGANLLVWTLFSIETLLRIYTWGRVEFFKQKLNIIDFAVVSFLGVTCIIELVLFAPVTSSTLDVNLEWDVQLVQMFHVILSTLRFVVVIRLGTAEDLRRKAYRTAAEIKDFQVTRGFEYSWLVQEDEVKFGEQIGVGSFGVVYLGLWQGTLVAVKKVLCPQMDANTRNKLLHEVKINSMLRHPNIVLLWVVSLLSEYCERGSLGRLIHDKKFDLKYAFVMKFSIDAAQGLAYLHSRNPPVLHRDLKSANLLVDSSWNLKISDFGTSSFLSNIGEESVIGTIQYTAPEILRNEPHTPAADIYSLGIIFMGNGDLPFKGRNRFELFLGIAEHGLKPDLEPCKANTSARYVYVMERCLAYEPEKRPNAMDLLELLYTVVDEDSDISTALLHFGTNKNVHSDSILFSGMEQVV